MFNQYTFLDYLKQIKKRLGKVILFTDGEQESINQEEGTKEYLKENNDLIKIFYLPKGSPEFNVVVDEFYRQGRKYDVLILEYYP